MFVALYDLLLLRPSQLSGFGPGKSGSLWKPGATDAGLQAGPLGPALSLVLLVLGWGLDWVLDGLDGLDWGWCWLGFWIGVGWVLLVDGTLWA